MDSFDWIEESLGGPDSILGWDQEVVTSDPLTNETVTTFMSWKPPIRIVKRAARRRSDEVVKLTYSFLNAGPIFLRLPFITRFKPALKHGERWVVPTENGLRSEPYKPELQRRYLRPSEAWFGVTHQSEGASNNRNINVYFPSGVLDAIEIKNAPDSTKLSIAACIYHLGLNPGCEAQFQCLLNLDAAEQGPLPIELTGELYAEYGPASPEVRQMAEAQLVQLKTESRRTLFNQSQAPVSALREQAHRLAGRRSDRLQLIRRLGDGCVTVDDVIRDLG